MEYFETWGAAITASLQDLFFTVIAYLPSLIAALVVLILGLLIAVSLGKLVKKLVELTKVDKVIEKIGLNKMADSLGKITISGMLGWIVKWFLIIVVLMSVADILGLSQIIQFLNDVAMYLPNVVIAIVILIIGFVGGNFVYDVVHHAVKAAKVNSPKFLANIAKWAVIVFALLASLVQLKIAASLVQTLFTGVIGMVALGGAIAFGLGGKDKAKQWLDSLEKKL